MIVRLLCFLSLCCVAFAADLPPSTYIKQRAVNQAADTSDGIIIGAGRVGGSSIPTGTAYNVVSYGADNTGAAACDSAVASAVSALISAGSGYVYFPAGRFKLNNNYLNMPPVVGAGMNLTYLEMRTGEEVAWKYGTASGFTNPTGTDADVTSTIAKGVGSVDINYTGDFSIGSGICLFFTDNVSKAAVEAGTVPFMMAPGAAPNYAPRRHFARVTYKTSGSVNFQPPIMHDVAAGETATAKASQIVTEGCQLWNLTLDYTYSSSTFAVAVNDHFNGTISGVRIYKPARYGLFINGCVYFDFIHSSIEEQQSGATPNSSGLLMHNSHQCLIEDNSFVDLNPGIEINFGSSGNTFGFNYFDKCVANINHGAYNHYNLYEGNILPQIKSDGYFGGSLYDCIFGNWLTGRRSRVDTGSMEGMIQLKRLTYKASVVRNYLGTDASNVVAPYASWGKPNIGNDTSYDTVQASAGDWWVAWDPVAALPRTWSGTVASGQGTTSGVLTFSGMATTGTGAQAHLENARDQIVLTWSGGQGYATPTYGSITGNNVTITNSRSILDQNVGVNLPTDGTTVTMVTNTSSFQEQDLDVAASSYKVRNYILAATGDTPGYISGESSIGGDTIPDSLYRTTKPDWFGDKPWPPFDTSRGAQPNYTDLPAAHRYINGNTDYLGGSTPSPSFRLNGRATLRRR